MRSRSRFGFGPRECWGGGWRGGGRQGRRESGRRRYVLGEEGAREEEAGGRERREPCGVGGGGMCAELGFMEWHSTDNYLRISSVISEWRLRETSHGWLLHVEIRRRFGKKQL